MDIVCKIDATRLLFTFFVIPIVTIFCKKMENFACHYYFMYIQPAFFSVKNEELSLSRVQHQIRVFETLLNSVKFSRENLVYPTFHVRNLSRSQ